MLKILNNKSDIKEAQQQFVEKFEQFIDEKILVKVGHLGESSKKKVSWVRKLDIWVSSQTISGSRYLNAFGIGKPSKGSNVSIICEINFPLNGIDRKIQGAFAKDNSGSVFIVHRGKIGGGRKGIGKSLFEDNYRGEWIVVEDDGVENAVALIGALNSSRFTRQVSQFIHEVDRIKGIASARPTQTKTSGDDYEFRKEFAGKKQYIIGKNVEAKCDHGLIVNDLASVLQCHGIKVKNDRNRDLYIVNSDGEIAAIFEIKPDISTTSLYSAVGQLLLNSVNLPKRPRLFLTIPKEATKIKGKLNKLGIELLIFRWSGDNAVFTELDSLNLYV